jgi:predicted dinucleotide-binding enzyme
MRVGILGSGDVGQSLGTGFVSLGHEVKLGSREAANERSTAWARKAGSNASTGTFEDAAQFGEVLLLATLGAAAEEAVRRAKAQHFRGKVVVDVTNPLEFHPNAPPSLFVGHTDSLGERVQRWLPDSRVVKAFNTVGYALFFRPNLPGGPPDMFICGNDGKAKETVTGILKDFGWPTIDLGGIEAARILEAMCLAWVGSAMRLGTWEIAFKVLRR